MWRFYLLILGLLAALQSAMCQDITQAEYFIDLGQAIGTNTPITISNTSTDTEISFNVPLNNIETGLHTLYVRAKDNSGKWSIASTRVFYVQPYIIDSSLVVGEYFIDTDPGFGSANSIILPNNNKEQEVAFDIDLTEVEEGLHTLYVRIKDGLGKWSIFSERLFYINNGRDLENIEKLEYYYISNEEFISEHVYNFPEPAPSIETDFVADASNLINGESYTIYILAVTESGVKSLINTESFTFTEAPPIIITNEVAQITCNGADDGSIKPTATGGEGSLLYSIDSVIFSADTTFRNLGPGEYTIYVKGDTPDYVESKTVILTEPEVLSLTVLNTLPPGCPDDLDGSIEVVANGGIGAYTYQLNGGNLSIESTFANLDGGNFTIKVTDENGCTTQQDVILDYKNPTPDKPVISIKSGEEGVSDILILTANSNADTYQWYINNEAILGATEQDYEVQPSDFNNNSSSNFTVEAAFIDGCSITSEPLAITGDEDEVFVSDMDIFPNPASSFFYVSNPWFEGEQLEWRLFNSTGSEVNFTLNRIDFQNFKFSLNDLPEGIYILFITTEKSKAQIKIQLKN